MWSPRKRKTLIYGAIKGMVGSLDPHSSFMTKEEFGELMAETKGSFFRDWNRNYHER